MVDFGKTNNYIRTGPVKNIGAPSLAPKEDPRLDDAAKGMEKIFIKFLLDEFRKAEDGADLFGTSKKKNDFFMGELYNQYAESAAQRGDFGFAKMIKSYVNKTHSNGRGK